MKDSSPNKEMGFPSVDSLKGTLAPRKGFAKIVAWYPLPARRRCSSWIRRTRSPVRIQPDHLPFCMLVPRRHGLWIGWVGPAHRPPFHQAEPHSLELHLHSVNQTISSVLLSHLSHSLHAPGKKPQKAADEKTEYRQGNDNLKKSEALVGLQENGRQTRKPYQGLLKSSGVKTANPPNRLIKIPAIVSGSTKRIGFPVATGFRLPLARTKRGDF